MKLVPEERVLDLAHSCAGLTGEHLTARLNDECFGDEVLRARVEDKIRRMKQSQLTAGFTNDYEKALPAHYKLIELIGRGGMAEVFRAEDSRLGRNVAIKFLNSEFRRDPDRMRRFHQEARAVSALNHPNIMVVHDIGESEGVQFIVTEFVQGETLGRRIARGKLGIPEAVDIAIQVASALAASHEAGIVHRDIKPDNVMIRRDGVVKVLDFGLAKETLDFGGNGIDANAVTLDKVMTSPGLIMGTPQYMSPEQARGAELDARTDIFSLGIILFEMVTGRPPFSGPSMVDTVAAIIGKEPRGLEEYVDDPPADLSRIIQKALRKERQDRYGTMEHMLSDLRDLRTQVAGSQEYGRQTGGTMAKVTLQNTMRTMAARFKRWDRLVFTACVAVVLGLAAWWFLGYARTTAEPPVMRSVAITSWSSEAGELTSSASFSPDGQMISFGSTRNGATEIWLKPTVGGEAIQITRNGAFNQYPVWSPNGQQVAFFSIRGTNSGIWRTSFTGGEQVEIASGLGNGARLLQWGKSGRLYVQDAMELFAFDERTGERSKLTDFAGRGLKPRTIELSRDESAIAYSIQEGPVWKIYVEQLPDGSRSEIAASNDQIDYLVWRPDNRSVVFSRSDAGVVQLFEAGIGSSPRQLSSSGTDVFVQDVAADDSRILYGSVGETSDLWKVNLDSGEEKLVSGETASEYWPDISPDGKNVVFQSVRQVGRPQHGSISISAVDGSGGSRVIAQTGFSPSWSADGQWIAYFKRENEQIGIWRVRPTGDEASKIVDAGALAPDYTETPFQKVGTNHLSWSPDGTSLAYIATAEGVANTFVAAFGSASSVNVSATGEKTAAYSSPIWTPDGRRLVVVTSLPSKTDPTRRTYRIVILDPEHSPERTLVESNDALRLLGLAHGGKEVLFARRADPTGLTLVAPSTSIYSVSLETGAQKQVNTLTDAYFHNINLSHDGSTLAFVTRRDNITALWTVPVNGGTPKRSLLENDPKALFSSLAWSPDGRSIVFGKQTRTNLISMLAK